MTADDFTRTHPLATDRVSALLLRFAIPSIVSMLVGALYNIVDQIFIGQGVGMLGNAATNVAFPLVAVCMSLALMLGIGGASNFNLEQGRGNRERAAMIVANSIAYGALFGVMIFISIRLALKPLLLAFGATPEVMPYAISYTGITSFGMPFMIMSVSGSHLMRADGSPRWSMVCNLTGALLNTVLDPLFIFTFDMGIEGAAWATVISQFVSWVLVVNYLRGFRSVKLYRRYFRPRLELLGSIAALGAGSSFNQLSMMAVQITMNNTLVHYGAMSLYGSNIPLAASGIIAKVNMIFVSIIIGIGQGGQPIIGFNYGAGNYGRVRATFRLTLAAATVVSIIGFACFQLFPRQIISIFGDGSEEYFIFSERFFRIFLFFTFINGIQPVTAQFFSSIGKATRGFFISLTRQILFLLPLIIILPRFLGIDGIMYAGPAADFVAAALTIAFIVAEIRDMRAKESEGASLAP